MRKAFIVGVVAALIAGLFHVVPAGAQEAPEPPSTSGGGLVTAGAPGTWAEEEVAGGIGSFAENPLFGAPVDELEEGEEAPDRGLGQGAYKMRTGNGDGSSGGRVFLSDSSFAGVPLDLLTPVGYSTLADERSLAHPWTAVTFEIPVYGHVGAVEDDDFFTTLVFEPRLAQTDQSTTGWKTWDLAGDPYWRLTGSNECDAGCTWDEVLGHVSTLPADAGEQDVPVDLLIIGETGIRLAAGTSGAGGDWTDFVGYVDAINVNAALGPATVRPAGEEITDFEAAVRDLHAPTADLHLVPGTSGPATAGFVAEEGGAFKVTTAPSPSPAASATPAPTAGEGFVNIPLADGVPLADLQELSYSTYVIDPTTDPNAMVLRLAIDHDASTATAPKTLVYEPTYDADFGPGTAVAQEEWQTWDTLTGSWWEVGAAEWRPLTWDEIVGDSGYPNAVIVPDGLTLTAGYDGPGDSWWGFSGLADDLVIATDGNVTNIDFEPANPPEIAGVTIQKPAAGVFTDSVLKAVAGEVSDPDDEQTDALTITFEWFRGGTSVQEGDTIDLNKPGKGSYGDTITVKATVKDPDGYTASVQDSVEVGNSAPTLSGATMSPTAPHSDSIVSARAGLTGDKDGHSVSYEYEWFRGTSATGTKIGTEHWIDLSKANTADANDTLTLRITPVDSVGGKGQPKEASVKVTAAPAPPPPGGGTNPPPATGGGTTPSPTPTATPTARPTPTPSPTPSASPTVTPSPTPSATPVPEKTERRSWTDLSIEKRSGAVSGRVLAAETACMAKRVVTITKVGRVGDRVIGRDRANNRGFWELKSRLKPGKYYASVQPIEIEVDEATTLRCDESETRAVRIKRYDRRWM